MERSPCLKDSLQLDLNEKQPKHLTKHFFHLSVVLYIIPIYDDEAFLFVKHMISHVNKRYLNIT